MIWFMCMERRKDLKVSQVVIADGLDGCLFIGRRKVSWYLLLCLLAHLFQFRMTVLLVRSQFVFHCSLGKMSSHFCHSSWLLLKKQCLKKQCGPTCQQFSCSLRNNWTVKTICGKKPRVCTSNIVSLWASMWWQRRNKQTKKKPINQLWIILECNPPPINNRVDFEPSLLAGE